MSMDVVRGLRLKVVCANMATMRSSASVLGPRLGCAAYTFHQMRKIGWRFPRHESPCPVGGGGGHVLAPIAVGLQSRPSLNC